MLRWGRGARQAYGFWGVSVGVFHLDIVYAVQSGNDPLVLLEHHILSLLRGIDPFIVVGSQGVGIISATAISLRPACGAGYPVVQGVIASPAGQEVITFPAGQLVIVCCSRFLYPFNGLCEEGVVGGKGGVGWRRFWATLRKQTVKRSCETLSEKPRKSSRRLIYRMSDIKNIRPYSHAV
jgi:hypothetical protein